MQRINATLPALGKVSVDFRKESDEILTLFGDSELERLRSVPHLGLVSGIFTGAHHSREEYMLLQCAVIDLLFKLHKGNPDFAISSPVQLSGMSVPISSGAELLKSWALLGNFGHARYTYAVERSIMRAAQNDAELLKWLVRCKNQYDIRRWAKNVLLESDDTNVHYVLVLARLQAFRKTAPVHYLRNLLLPAEVLFPQSLQTRNKIIRLRRLFGRIRSLCMATLDSYYSHQPIHIQIGSAIIGLAELTPPEGEQRPFDDLLNHANGWLADELYLHPRSCAALSWYEDTATPRVQQLFGHSHTEREKFGSLKSLLKSGVMSPKVEERVPMVRLKFRGDVLPTTASIDKLVGDFQMPKVSRNTVFRITNRNVANDLVYFDLIYKKKKFSLQKTSPALAEAFLWLIRRVNRQVDSRIDEYFPEGLEGILAPEQISMLERQIFEEEISIEFRNFARLFKCFVQLLIPEDLRMQITEFTPTLGRPVPALVRIRYRRENVFDQIADRLRTSQTNNPDGEARPRIQEYLAIESVVERSTADIVIACAEKITLHKIGAVDGKAIDEWDGLVMEFYDDSIKLSIIEAKRLSGPKRNENEAMKQLDLTRKLLGTRVDASYRRQRIKGIGAYLRYTVPIDQP